MPLFEVFQFTLGESTHRPSLLLNDWRSKRDHCGTRSGLFLFTQIKADSTRFELATGCPAPPFQGGR